MPVTSVRAAGTRRRSRCTVDISGAGCSGPSRKLWNASERDGSRKLKVIFEPDGAGWHVHVPDVAGSCSFRHDCLPNVLAFSCGRHRLLGGAASTSYLRISIIRRAGGRQCT